MLAALRQVRQVLADFDARRRRRNGSELPANSFRRPRLEVETFVLRQPAGKKNVDARLGGTTTSCRRV